MRALPLFRFNRRARSTSWGIALCTMFIVASFSIAAGLRTSMDALSDNFSTEYSVVTYPGASGMDPFEPSVLGTAQARSALCVVAVVWAGEADQVVFSVSDPGSVLPETLATSGTEVKAGSEVAIEGTATLVGETSQVVTVVSGFSSTMFSPSWVLGSEELLVALTGFPAGSCNLAISRDLSQSEMASLESAGFVVQPTVSIIEFLDSGVDDLQSDAYWVLVPSAFVIAVLVYSFIGSEVVDKRHDIGIIKTLGAGRGRVLAYLLGESLLICAYGAVLGVALGIVMSYAVSTAASHVFTSVFSVEVDEMLLLVSYLVAVAAGMAGSLLPAAKMTMTSPAQDLREGSPF